MVFLCLLWHHQNFSNFNSLHSMNSNGNCGNTHSRVCLRCVVDATATSNFVCKANEPKSVRVQRRSKKKKRENGTTTTPPPSKRNQQRYVTLNLTANVLMLMIADKRKLHSADEWIKTSRLFTASISAQRKCENINLNQHQRQ